MTKGSQTKTLINLVGDYVVEHETSFTDLMAALTTLMYNTSLGSSLVRGITPTEGFANHVAIMEEHWGEFLKLPSTRAKIALAEVLIRTARGVHEI